MIRSIRRVVRFAKSHAVIAPVRKAPARRLNIETLEPRLALASIPFATPPPITTTANGAASVVSADIDRDGDMDLVAASSDDNTIAWYSHLDGVGTFGPAQVIDNAATGAARARTADLDRDGDLDVLAVAKDNDTIAWYENLNGLGSFGTANIISASADGAADALAVDIDRDGDLDVLVASAEDNTVTWYENTDGAGTFGSQQVISSTSAGARSVFAADLDRDGDPDVLTASAADHTIAWYENTDGAGTFGSAQTISTTAQGARAAQAADLDGDGDLDVLSASYDDDTIAWFENTDGAATFGTRQTITATADGASDVVARDMDGDGDLDVVAASAYDDTIAWFENSDGSGNFAAKQTITASANGAQSVFSADLDRDGDLDVLSASKDDDTLAWFRNETIHASAVFFDPTTEMHPVEISRTSVEVADLDGDGDLDGFLTFSDYNQISWFENIDGAGTLTGHPLDSGPQRPASIVATDVDRDGDLDAVASSVGDDQVFWYENTDAAGTFGPLSLISLSDDNPAHVHVDDVDGDGDMDVLVAAVIGDTFAWYENTDGAGSFAPQQIISDTADDPTSIYTHDVDGDGDVDVLATSCEDDTVAWFANDGSGGFGTAQVIDDGADCAYGVHAGDLDGDGDPDVVSSTIYSDTVAWYENLDGQGTFGPRQTLTTEADWSEWVRAVDIDRDGDLDVVWTARRDDKIEWRENLDGSGTFGPTHIVSSLAHSAVEFDIADIDGDGDLDVFPANLLGLETVWYENRGGQFALPTDNTALPTVIEGRGDDILRIDMVHRGRAGDHSEELVALALLLEEDQGDPLTTDEAKALVDALDIYRDEGSGEFEPDTDTLVTSLETLDLTNGLQTIAFVDGDPNVQVAFASPATFFVVARLTPDATEQPVDQFRITHVAEGPTASRGEDADADIPITLELPENVASIIVQAGKLGDMDRDGDVDLDDVSPFVQGLTDAAAYENAHGLPSSVHGDIDADGDHDLDDVDPFVLLLTGGSGGSAGTGGGAESPSHRTTTAESSDSTAAATSQPPVAETSPGASSTKRRAETLSADRSGPFTPAERPARRPSQAARESETLYRTRFVSREAAQHEDPAEESPPDAEWHGRVFPSPGTRLS